MLKPRKKMPVLQKACSNDKLHVLYDHGSFRTALHFSSTSSEGPGET